MTHEVTRHLNNGKTELWSCILPTHLGEKKNEDVSYHLWGNNLHEFASFRQHFIQRLHIFLLVLLYTHARHSSHTPPSIWIFLFLIIPDLRHQNPNSYTQSSLLCQRPKLVILQGRALESPGHDCKKNREKTSLGFQKQQKCIS